MKAKEKSVFNLYKMYWEYGKKITEYDNKIAVFIKNYSINQIYSSFKKNSSILNESDKKEFEVMIKELMQDKKELGKEFICTQEEYTTFLSDAFNKIDEEDRHGDVTMNTSYSFKLVGDLVDLFSIWGSIPEEWMKKKKYCKFKAVDIFKCIKQGIQPKRGGPKEEDQSNIAKELSDISFKENKFEDEKKEEMIRTDSKIEFQPLSSLENKTIQVFENFETYQNNQNPPLIDINSIQTYKNDIAERLSKDDIILKKSSVIEDITLTPKYNNIRLLDRLNNDMNAKEIPIHKNCIKNIVIKPGMKLDPKIQKKISFDLPVKYKSIDYFRLTDIIFKLLENGMREIQSDKVEKSLVQLELAIYYLHNIEM